MVMRVLHVYRTYFPDPPGGLQEAIRQICLATRAEGIDPSVFTLSPQPEPAELHPPEGRVIRCKSWGAPASCDIGGADTFARFHALAMESDLLHYHFPWPFADILHLTAARHKPAVMTYHSDIVRQRWLAKAYSPLMNGMLDKMHAVVATSPNYAETSPVLMKIMPQSRVRIIPLGIVDYSQTKTEPCALLQKHGLDKEPYFMSLGVLRYYKGLHNLVRAALGVNAKVVIAGEGPEGDDLKALSERLGARNVIFTGQVTDAEKIALLKNCRAFVLPSHVRSEAFGMVLTEAAMFGKPMVCCEVGSGTSFVNEHDVTGFVVPPENPARLATSMTRLLNDDSLANRMGLAARARYERLFSGKALGEAYAGLYRETVKTA